MIDLKLGDCLAVMSTLDAESVDAVVTDPPAGIEFMGKDWDSFRGDRRQPGDPTFHKSGVGPFDRAKVRHGTSSGYGNRDMRRIFLDFLTPRLAECLRVARPGARMLCWAIPRTSHWTGTAIEDAGWIIEDRISHLFGQGFPKAKSKLKPACEDWWLARKPGGKVPALEIDRCRIGTTDALSQGSHRPGANFSDDAYVWKGEGNGQHPAGRWPANLVLSHCTLPVMRLMDHRPSDTIERIRRHYDGYDRVQVLRENRLGVAVLRQAGTEVLRQGVCGPSEAGSPEGCPGHPVLLDVQEGISVPSVMGEGRAEEVLFAGLQESASVQGHRRRKASPLRQVAHDERQDQDGERCSSQGDGYSRPEASGMEGRDLHSARRISLCHDRKPSGRPTSNGAADAADSGLHHGASCCRGDGGRETAPAERSCSSQERDQVGQQVPEPCFDGPGAAFSEASEYGEGTSDGPGGYRGDEGRDCSLEVLAEDIPQEWLCHFTPTGEDLGCREVGTRRVKGSHDRQPASPEGERRANRDNWRFAARTANHTDSDGRETVAAWECVDGCPIAELDCQSGDRPNGYRPNLIGKHYDADNNIMGKHRGKPFRGGPNDSGGASRFFATFGYFPKASRSDRGEGNTHPTCKNTDLMSWLARLITPAGGTVLDPFLGSGSTGVACIREGFSFIGIEQDPAYMAIAWSRINEARASAPLFAAIAP